jgi:radical SAM superfamily enzyme YgiQ (UPF0313 family)
MRIVFISPKVKFNTSICQLNTFWEGLNKVSPNSNLWFGVSTALLTVAALTPSKYDINFIDENVQEIDFSVEYDLVAISLMTQQAFRAYYLAREFKKRKAIVVLGGIHASLLPKEAILNADSIVIGEAEYVWEKVIKDFENNALQKYYLSDKEVNLNDSPIPRYDLMEKNKYKYINIQASRGCPHNCDYCTASKIFGFKYRNKSINQVINEIKIIKKTFKDPFIAFSDDNLLVNRGWSIELLQELSELKIRWHAQSDISIGNNDQLLSLMKKSGCNFVFIGIETVTKEGLYTLDKKKWKMKQLDNYSGYIKNIQDHGIGVIGSFMLGLDSDDKKIFNKIQRFVTDNLLYGSSYTILTPYPGSKIREQFKKENRLLSDSWEQYTGYNVVFNPKNIKKEDLEKGIVSLYLNTYTKENYENKMKYFKSVQKKLIKNS